MRNDKSKATQKIAIVYARFGPYHMARLRAAQDFFSELGWTVVGIEVCPDDKFYAWDKIENRSGLHQVPVLSGGNYRDYSRKEIQEGIRKTLDAELPDVVALPGWYYAEAVGGLRWCLKNQRMPILMSESSQHDTKRVFWKEWLKKARVRQFSAALVGGSSHAEYLRKLGMKDDHVFYGHNVVDNAYFCAHSDEARAPNAELRQSFQLPDRYILASGRFILVKNFARLLQAYRLYYDKVGAAAFHLVLCGEGEERSNLEKQIQNLALQDKVILPGFVQYEELPTYYGLASVFVHPSTVEPWGLVVNEAMAAGLPVLVSNRCGCAPDLVKDGVNGYTFDPYNVEQMADQILEIHQHKDTLLDMGQASSEIISHWDPDRFAEGLWNAVCTAKQDYGID